MNTPKIISTLLKKYRLLIGVLLLTTVAACGGGGGGNSASPPPLPQITAAQCNAQNLILQSGQCVSECSTALPRIESNECMVGSTLNEAELAEKKSICIASDMVFNGKYAEDICITCTGDTPIRNINTCEPSQAVCNSQDMILKNGACSTCTGDTPTHNGNTCEPSESICNRDSEVLRNGQCISCTTINPNTPVRNGNACEPSQAICNNQNMILESGACSSCTGNTPTRNGNVCEPSQLICNNQNMILESGACSSCTGDTPTRNGNVCEPSQLICNNQNMILESGACSSCTGDTVRNGNTCTARISPETCSTQNMILKDGLCQACPDGSTSVTNNICINKTLAAPNPSNGIDYETIEGHEEYTTGYGKENIGAHFAYQRGYWGQGVTVAIIDSELDVNHPDLAPNLAGVYHPTTKELTSTLARSSHGTQIAGIIGAARNSIALHGVAPSVRLFGIVGLPSDGQTQAIQEAWRFASTVAPIVNNSYGGLNRVVGNYEGTTYFAKIPIFGRGLGLKIGSTTATPYEGVPGGRGDRHLLTTYFGNKDIVMVFAAGNEYWRVDSTILLCPTSRLNVFFGQPLCFGDGSQLVPIQDFIDKFTLTSFTRRGIDGETWTSRYSNELRFTAPISELKTTDSSFYLYAPHVDTQLRDRWLGVVATDSNNQIASSSNGCGDSKYWCLAAPGKGITVLVTNSTIKYGTSDGTSFAAPFVSGALALLKSRFPNMPMKVIRAILLTTATDLPLTIKTVTNGITTTITAPAGIDDVYGWGLVNIERAITLQGGLLLPFGGSGAPPDSSGVSGVNGVRLADAHINLPEQFSHIQSHLSSISIAVSVVGNAYYNADLSQLVRIEQKIQHRTFGNAANEILNTTAQRQVRSGAWFAATDANGKIRQAGAQTNFSELGLDFAGTWQLRHDFCDDCQDSVWHEWRQWNKSTDANQNHLSKNATAKNVTDDLADMTDGMQSPFFARRSGAIIIAQQGEGLRPFIAHSGKLDGNENATYKQIGLRWQQHFTAANKMRFDIAASASRIDEKNSLWGADFGALVIGGRDAINMRTKQGRLLIRGAFGKNWRGFASIEEARGDNYRAESGGLLNGVSNLRARGWSGGVETHSIFSGGDILRLSARRETRIIGGSATIKHRQAEGDFSGAFYGSIKDAPEELKDEQQLIDTTSIINLGSKARDIYAIGYILKPTNNGKSQSRLAIGIEHDTSGKTAASAQWHIDF